MHILSLDIFRGKYDDFLEIIKNPSKPILVFTPNPEILVQAENERDFFEILRQADYLTPDANGLYTASLLWEWNSFISSLFQTFFKRNQLIEKYGELIRWSSLTKDLVDFAIESHLTIMVIDNYRIVEAKNPFEVKKREIQGKFQELFREKFPDLQVEILFDGENSAQEIANMIQKIEIRYVFACIGMKTQEKRLVEIFSYLPKDFRVVGLGVGSSFDYLLGLQKRAPEIFQKLWLEWLYRLLQDPKKRWKRIKTALIDFPKIIQSKK